MNPFPRFINNATVSRPQNVWVDADLAATGSQYLGHPLTARQRMVVGIILIATVAIMLGRAAQLQLFHGAAYRVLAEGNRIRTYTTLAPRGVVYDRYGIALTENTPQLSVALIPFDVPRDEPARAQLFQHVAAAVQTDPSIFFDKWNGFSSEQRRSVEPFIVIPNVEVEQGLQLQAMAPAWPGIVVLTTPRRDYIASRDGLYGLSHVVGYVSRVGDGELSSERGYARSDIVGRSGVEQAYETYLKGTNGRQEVEVDALGALQHIYAEVAPTPGNNVWLSIDSELQQVLEAAMLSGLGRAKGQRGVGVVLDPRNGEVLALASYPGFDANMFTEGNNGYAALAADPNQPLFNRVVQGRYPSGSTIKPFVAAAALEEKIITPLTSFLSTGGISVGQWFFPDWKAGGHGQTDVRKAIAESVNTFFYIIGGGYGDQPGLGIEALSAYEARFGFGAVTGIDLPGEVSGLLPTPAWKKEVKGESWYIGDTYHAAIGQGDVLVTPLQIAAATAILANGGKRITPHVLYEVEGHSDRKPPTEIIGIGLTEDTVAVVREGMRRTVTDGSARSLGTLPITAAGKTGTAEVGGDIATHAWFSGFAPYENPQLVITILLENVGEGSSFAVPVARDVLTWWAAHRAE
ncbi:MAG: penicillin-binding protein 2 [Patescibacteria group bacterium]